MPSRGSRFGILFLLLAIGLSVSAFAQLPTGTILGVVKDPSGAVIPNVTITIRSVETGQTRTTAVSTNGEYRVPALPVGHYDIKADSPGFSVQTQTGLDLEVAQDAVVNFTLQVGTAQQQITVTGEAALVNTTNSSLGGLVDEQKMSDLPLNGRNYADLTLLQAGITVHTDRSNSGGNMPGNMFSSNGAPLRSNSYMLDGALLVNTYAASAASGTGNTLGVEGIREYKVITNNVSAEYGMTMGSQTVLVSKSGGNVFHGSAFEFLRNSALDAANFFDKPVLANGFRRLPAFRRNNFGGSGGGPIQKDKTFFFAAYEALREQIGQTIISNTFPATCFTRTANPCAITPADPSGAVQAAAFQILQLYPMPNLPNSQYTYPAPEPLSDDWGQLRFDHTFSASDSAFARYTVDDSFFKFDLAFQPFFQSQATRGQFLTFSENHVFSQALLNTARFSFSRTSTHTASPSDFGANYPNLIPGQEVAGLASFSIGGVTAIGPTSTQPEIISQNIFTYSDDLFYVKGKHSFKFGLLINHFQQDMNSPSFGRGTPSFGSEASFLDTGTISSITILDPGAIFTRHWRNNTFGVYAQDDFHLLPRLTLNLGLRYEFATVVNDRDGLNASASPQCNFPCAQFGPSYQNPSLHNFSPRIGFAWDVLGDGKTSVRGGAALLYDIETLGAGLVMGLTGTPPYALETKLSNLTLSFPLNLPSPLLGNNTFGVDYLQKQPKMYQYNLTLERQLPGAVNVEVSYVGSRGIHLLQFSEANPVIPQFINGQPFWTSASKRLNPTWGTFNVIIPDGDSFYNALEVNVTKRLGHGLQFQSTYTYSKLIDDTQGQTGSENSATSSLPTTPLDLALDRSISPFDVRNNYRFNMLYNLPTSGSSNRFVKGLVNGWWTSAILSAQNGYPFTPSLSTNRSLSGTGGAGSGPDRPDFLPGRNNSNVTQGTSSGCTVGTGPTAVAIPAGTPLGTPNLYFDPCAFTLAPVGYEGNAGRDSLIGPGLLDLDYSIVKDTPLRWLGEAGKLEFRAELFNILNHPNFAQPARAVFAGSSTTACPVSGCPVGTENPLANTGQITGTAAGAAATQASGNSRQIQFGLKVIF